MPFKDIDIFLRAAGAILQGQDPYSIPNLEVFYPLPFYFLFVPLAGLPAAFVHVAWTGLQMVVFAAVLRRRAVWTMLSMPVVLTFLMGQVDILMLALYVLLRSGIAGGLALAFMVLKPQLVLLLAPWMLWYWWRRDRRQIVLFALVLGVLVAGSFVIQADWPLRFIARSGERTRAGISSSLWGLLTVLPSPWWLAAAMVTSISLAVWSWRKDDLDLVAACGLFVSPFVFSYNLLPLLAMIRRPAWLVGWTCLSWVAFAVSAWSSNDRASALLTLAVLAVLIWEGRRNGMRTTQLGAAPAGG